MLKISRYVMAVLLLCFSWVARAADADQLYQIEVIVYSHITNEALQSEYWPPATAITIPPDAIELSGDQIVPPSQWQLSATQKTLEKNKYQILIHQAWQIRASSLQQPKIIHLSGGSMKDSEIKQVNGIIAIKLERYFSVHFKLQFLLPSANTQDLTNISRTDNDTNLKFNLNAHLRMRSNELNYIDHPLYGVLIKIIPLPEPAA